MNLPFSTLILCDGINLVKARPVFLANLQFSLYSRRKK